MNPEQHDQSVAAMKHVGDVLTGLIVLGALAKILPPLSAFLAIIYTLIRIYESNTFKRFAGWLRGEEP